MINFYRHISVFVSVLLTVLLGYPLLFPWPSAYAQKSTTVVPPAANWRVYESKDKLYALRYPPHFPVVQEDSKTVVFSSHADTKAPFPDLTISVLTGAGPTQPPYCAQVVGKPVTFPCIQSGRNWGQEADVMPLSIGGVPAISFYLGSVSDTSYHIVQTTEQPKIELKMYIGDQEAEQTFQQMLQTITFHPQEQWNDYINYDLRFHVKYPIRLGNKQPIWRYEEWPDAVHFGPASAETTTPIWSIQRYPANKINEVAAAVGSQFTKREQTIDVVTVNSHPALLVTVTTPEAKRWSSQSVYLLEGTMVYVINNSADQLPEFEQFYSSFSLMH